MSHMPNFLLKAFISNCLRLFYHLPYDDRLRGPLLLVICTNCDHHLRGLRLQFICTRTEPLKAAGKTIRGEKKQQQQHSDRTVLVFDEE